MIPSAIIVQFLGVFWVARVVAGQTYTAECNEKTMAENGGFREHPTDCSKYIRCLFNEDGQLVPFLQDCGFGTYWNKIIRTCMLATDTECKHDQCVQQSDGNRRNGHGNCRGFYECQKSLSIPKCCPFGQFFHDSLVCVNVTTDMTCNKRCFDTIPYTNTGKQFGDVKSRHTQEETNSTGWRLFSGINQQASVDRPVKGDVKPIVGWTNTAQVQPNAAVCDKSVIPKNPGKYKQTLYGGWTIKRRCPTGTIFVQAVCNCLSLLDQTEIPEFPRKSVNNLTQTTICTPIIHLPFTLDVQDQSGNGYRIINHNVTVRDGKAIFDGRAHFLTIPMFPKLDITNSLVIKVVYSSYHESIPRNRLRTIFSNDGCNEAPSVFMYENLNETIGGIGTSKTHNVHIQQRHTHPGQEPSIKEVMYMFHGGDFTLKNGDVSKTVGVKGGFKKIECPLHIGYGADIQPFKGEIDEFTVYMCQNVLSVAHII